MTHLNGEHVATIWRQIATRRQRFDAGSRAEAEGNVLLGHATTYRKQGDGAGAVTAHLGQRTVRIAVIHEPDSATVMQCLHLRFIQIGDIFRRRQSNQTIAPDAEMAIGQPTSLIDGGVPFTVWVEIHNEIVAGGVRFGHMLGNAHVTNHTLRRGPIDRQVR